MSEMRKWMREVFKGSTVDAVARGFRGTGIALERRHGRTRQILNFQPHKRNQADFGEFFINVGVELDELPVLGHGRIEGVDWCVRLERLCPELPISHVLQHSTDRDALAATLRPKLAVALDVLERMKTARDVLDTIDALPFVPKLDAGFHLELRARLKHAAGDLTGALDDLIELKRTFPDRVDIRALATYSRLDGLDLARADNEPLGPPREPHNQEIRGRDVEDARRTEDLRREYEERERAAAAEAAREDRVRHPTFGEGLVLSRDGTGPTAKLQVQFADQVRVIQARFVTAM